MKKVDFRDSNQNENGYDSVANLNTGTPINYIIQSFVYVVQVLITIPISILWLKC